MRPNPVKTKLLAGQPVFGTFGHPDGNGLELYVDPDATIWHKDPSAVLTSVPLEL